MELYFVSCSSYTFLYYPGSERSGEDGVQGGDLQQYDHRVREARHPGLHLDPPQSINLNNFGIFLATLFRPKRTGKRAQNRRNTMYNNSMSNCNKNPVLFSREHGSVRVQSKTEKGREGLLNYLTVFCFALPKWPYLLKIFSFHTVKRFIYLQRHKYPY